jgi:hypothetical protein
MAVPRLGGSCHAPRTRSEPSAEPPATRSGPRPGAKSDTVAIPLTSVHAPAALSDGDPVALGRDAEDSEVEGDMVAAWRGRKGKRAEYRCTFCGYGIVVYGQSPSCPMCREASWEHVEWRPFSSAARRRWPSFWHPKPATSPPRALPASGRGVDPLPSSGQSRSIARKRTPKEKLAQLASARTLVRSYARTESGVELPRRARPPPAAERGRGGAPSPDGSSVATSLPRSRWSTRTCASSSRSPSAIAAAAFPSST